MLSNTQKRTAEAIVNIFETSEVRGDYSLVTILPKDTGHLTFGRSQTTLGSGNLYDLVRRYCDNSGSRFGSQLRPWLQRMADKDVRLDDETKLHNLLRASADDPVMRDVQDAFFDEYYWHPATRAADREGITSTLGMAVVYDSHVHGSWQAMRDRTNKLVGRLAAAGEQVWLKSYISTRRNWLATNTNESLPPTVYRMDAFNRLMDQGHWGLELPLVVRGKEISLFTLSETPAHCYEGPQPGSRSLTLQQPLQRGLDVRLVQLGLSEQGIDINADGIFGRTSMQLVQQFQKARGLPPTGVVDALLIATLIS